jgi:TetR/AcrR family transcriptional repressor of mexJK operon
VETPSPAPEDPRVTRSRARALDASAAVFVERGFAGSTMQDVAERANLAKRTLYNLYEEKDALFRATMHKSIATAEQFSASLARDTDAVTNPHDQLPRIGMRLAEIVVTTRVLGLRRLMLMESERFPDLAAEYRRRAPDAVLAALARMFDSLIRAGSIRSGDPIITAEHFAFLVMGSDLDRGTFTGRVVSRTRAQRRARAGVDVFLRAYAPDD